MLLESAFPNNFITASAAFCAKVKNSLKSVTTRSVSLL